MVSNGTHIYDLVRRWETRQPDRVAVRFAGTTRSWAELATRVRRNANAQRDLALWPGDRVAFLDRNHPACVETTLACGLAGTVNAVINGGLSADELVFVINDSTAKVLFVGADLVPLVERIRPRLHTVRRVITVGGPDDDYEAFLAGADDAEFPHAARPDDCFLQLYSLGTTGRPKGAMLTHRSVLTHSNALGARLAIDGDAVMMVAMPLFHVGGTCWALAALWAGGEITIVRDGVAGALERISRDRVTHALFATSALRCFLALADVEGRGLSTLRCLCYGGSRAPERLLRRVMSRLSTNLYQVYGMTETSGACCVLDPEDHRADRLDSAGRPIDGIELRVVDPDTGQVLGDNEVGEFHIRGDQVMAGYWADPKDTAATLVDGWLRTGDTGYRDSGGYVHVHDHVDDVIVSGGQNTYPAEVERVIRELPEVADAAVIGLPGERCGEVVHAVVVPRQGMCVDPDTVLAHCRDHLAGTKCPTTVSVVERLPRNPSGKILKRTLRESHGAGHEHSA
jgi:acyl-CoA synthetase (AMP-forming)/AMP-acid ligase II